MPQVEAVKDKFQRKYIQDRLRECGQVYADIWNLGTNTALRIGDLLSLTMDDVKGIDLDADKIRLNITEQKTQKARSILLNQTALEILQRRLKENPKQKYLFQSDARNIGRQSKPVNRRSVLRVFSKVGESCAPQIALGTHSMRKTCGYAMHQSGKSVDFICKVLNHSSPAITLRYIGIEQQDIDQAFIDLEL